MEKVIISPSILSADFANLERDVKLVENAGADWIHVDVMDGHFVPNITIGIPVVKSLRAITCLPLDVHLMIENPEKYIEDFANAGADIITFHYESYVKEKNINISGCHAFAVEEDTDSLVGSYPPAIRIADTISKIKSLGKKVGMSIKPNTHPDALIPYLKDLDLVLVMTVEPGFSGQSFIPSCSQKIKDIKNLASKNLIIQVDGGINDLTAKICKDFGANALVAGNYIYKSSNLELAINSLR